jgi:hypothetical protein
MPPNKALTGDILNVRVLGTLPDTPIEGEFRVWPDGTIWLGQSDGAANVSGLTVGEVCALALVVLGIYLFASAPPPLTNPATDAREVPIELVLATVAAENDVARALYTQEIVGQGLARGLRFDELWRQEGVQAGPLPALFLREAASSIQHSSVPLGLFLGSDFPISPANKFTGKQAAYFRDMHTSEKPIFFYAEDTGQHTAMFPDRASAAACVECHNGHDKSPKHDWKLNDLMGATTWSYPKKAVSFEEYLAIVHAVRRGFGAAYTSYLEKVKTFDAAARPAVGEKWPRDGFCLPSADIFLAEFERQSSAATVQRLLDAAANAKATGQEKARSGSHQ